MSLSAKYTDSMCLAPARFLGQSAGDCKWSIALQLLFQLETLLIGLFISWGVKLFSSVKMHKIQRIGRVHITVHIYCLITCNIKSLLNVPKISHISRKISQVSRFPAKSPDSRNKFVFLPKQPLLELSPPVCFIQVDLKSFLGPVQTSNFTSGPTFVPAFSQVINSGHSNFLTVNQETNTSKEGVRLIQVSLYLKQHLQNMEQLRYLRSPRSGFPRVCFCQT